jgi:integrase
LLQTGLRRGDAVAFGRQHLRTVEGIKVAVLNTEKSNQNVPAILPITPELEKIMAAEPCGDLTFICGAIGRPFTKESFGNEFRDACTAAGVLGSAHGLRKTCLNTRGPRGSYHGADACVVRLDIRCHAVVLHQGSGPAAACA